MPPLLPAPKKLRAGTGLLLLSRQMPIVLSANADETTWHTATVLRDAIASACKLSLPVEGHLHVTGLGPHISLDHDRLGTGIDGDRYRIDITDDAVAIRAGGAAGLRYAVETLTQLLKTSGSLPQCSIEDQPDFALRGVMLDISRGKVPTPATLRGVVDICTKLKLNTLMLYTEHTFRFRRHPKIGKDDSPLDAETMRALDLYAAQNHVELIPCLQSLGHMDHILSLPEYRALAETEMGWTIAPVNPGSIALLRDMYDEYLPNFRSKFVNANCDEPWDLGRGQSKARSESLGPGGLYLEHVKKLRRLAKRNGKRTMIWGDVVHAHPERIAEIPKDMVMLDWWYEAKFNYNRIKVFKDNGLDFAVCPGTSTWNSLFPRIENSVRNIAGWARAGRRHGARGIVNTDWGDFGHYNLLGNSWFAYAYGAQQSWSGDIDDREFDSAFSKRLFEEEGGRGEIGSLYRALGSVHDPGFQIFNGSPIQYLFFDDLEESYFISGCKKSALARSLKQAEHVRVQIEAAKDLFKAERATWRELAYAADATAFALEKTLTARRYNEWRRKPQSLSSRERTRLAVELRGRAAAQAKLLTRFRKLWLARNSVSNLEMTERRIKRSIKSLKIAATHLTKNNAPVPVKKHAIDGKGAIASVRRSFAPVV